MDMKPTQSWLKNHMENAPDLPCDVGGSAAPTKTLFSKKLKQERLAWGYSQEVLSEKSGVSVHKIRRMEQGNRSPNGHDLYAIAKALKQSALWFFNE
jgi:ribosome-binding protein aMBF1 (putative translation factor)